jgi:D-tyrosyl-tRNA(Tyr) deacylase
MRAVVQRVTRAKVTVADEILGEIKNGLVVLLGVVRDDSEVDAEYLAAKIVSLRIFPRSLPSRVEIRPSKPPAK